MQGSPAYGKMRQTRKREVCHMTLFIFGFALVLLPILFRLALKLRLGIPMLYALLMLTAFHDFSISAFILSLARITECLIDCGLQCSISPI